MHGSPERACHLAKHAFDEALAGLDIGQAERSPSKTITMLDSLQILQLLMDDLTQWSGEIQEQGEWLLILDDEARITHSVADTGAAK